MALVPRSGAAAVARMGGVLPDRVDAVIVGGGASGLALAGHLATTSWRDHSVLVVDDGSLPLDARSWAYWSAAPAPLDWFDRASSQVFDRFWVNSAAGQHLVRLGSYRYRVVRGPDLERAVNGVLHRAEGFRRVAGHVTAIEDGEQQATVTVDGQRVRADWVFDSVGLSGVGVSGVAPPRTKPPGVGRSGVGATTLPSGRLSMAFTGWRVQTRGDVFDPEALTLMDFRTGQDHGLAFLHVLPTSARSALVEHTRFVSCDVGGVDAGNVAEAALDGYLRDVLGVAGHRVVGVERGSIGLQPRAAAGTGQRVVPIGAQAGMVKPSTGYAYARIHRHCEALAWSLATRGHPFDVPQPLRRYALLDQVLLDAVVEEPLHVVHAFEQLFRHNPGDRVLAFLDERVSLAQELALVRSLPKGPFLRAARRVRARAGR